MTSLTRLRVGLLTPALGLLLASGAQAQAPGLLMQLAEASRKETGNLRFDVVQHVMRRNHFTVIESWRDQRALDAHTSASHTKQYREALTTITGSPLDENVYRRVQ